MSLENKLFDRLKMIGGGKESIVGLGIDCIEPITKHQFIKTVSYLNLNDLTDNNLILVYKGIILAESTKNWYDGSVDVSIPVYFEIKRRGLDKDLMIADFALRHTSNPYIPFGNMYVGVRSKAGYLLELELKKESIERNNKQVARVKGRKKRRSLALAELRKLSFDERGLLRKKLLEKYSAFSHEERLKIVADDEKYPPEYYPVEWFKINDAIVASLPFDLVRKLHDKLSTKTLGPWKQFARKLKKRDPDKIFW